MWGLWCSVLRWGHAPKRVSVHGNCIRAPANNHSASGAHAGIVGMIRFPTAVWISMAVILLISTVLAMVASRVLPGKADSNVAALGNRTANICRTRKATMPITAKMWGDDHPFDSLHKVERLIREFLAANPDKGYSIPEIYDAVIPKDSMHPRHKTYEPVQYIVTLMYCNGCCNTVRLDGGIVRQSNTRYFRHRPGTEPIWNGPSPDDVYFPDRRGSTERRSDHDQIERTPAQ